jgi:hypothetical protein
MNEITTSATKAKTAKHMRDSFGLSKNAIPQLEVPADFREMIDKGVAQARDAYAKAKAAGEEAADLLKTTYATAAKGATGYNLKLIEIARANAGAAFDYAHELLGVKSRPSLSRCRRRRCASNSISLPRRIRNFSRSLSRSRPRLPSQSRQACPRH